MLLRAGLHPHRPTSLTTYLTGGSAWAASRPLYTNWRGFVYPPVIALLFSLFARIPLALAAVLWRLLTAGIFLLGATQVLRLNVFQRILSKNRGLVLIALLPLSLGNIDNAQANPLIAGLMMLSVAFLQAEAWTLCALTAAVATTFKIYPVALALLLCLLRPRPLIWRFALILVLLALLPFALKDSHYVSSQYHAWWQTRVSDDRFQYPIKDAPLDLWYLLVRLGHLPVGEKVYTVFQALSGIALAGFVWDQSRRSIPLVDILAGLFLLVSVWMLLLGPATENQTYVVLAPAACLMAVQSLNSRTALLTRVLALGAFGLLLGAVARNSLIPSLKSPVYMAIQPVAALVLLTAIFCDIRRKSAAS